MTEENVIEEARKALKDIGHWENFQYERAKLFDKGYYENDPHWMVYFEHTEDDYKKGIVSPYIKIDDLSGRVKQISWSRSHFFLNYDENKEKYHHPRLSREQPKLD